MTEEKITPDEHSDVVGGSTAGRVLACPGSVKLNQAVKRAHKERILEQLKEDHGLSPSLTMDRMPEEVAADVDVVYRAETTSEYAAEGSGLHEAMAWILENDEEPESVVDRTFEGILITPTLYSEAIIPALQGFDDFCDQVFEEDGEELEFVVEKRCQLPGIPGAFGTSDIIGKTSKRLVIWDWKFGAGKPVTPYKNDQLRFYGRASVHTMQDWLGYPEGESEGHPSLDLRVDLVISQPRIGDGQPQIWTTNYKDLEEFRKRLIRAVSEATSDDPRVKRGDHCLWCEAKHICPAKQQLAQRICERVDDALDEVPDDDTEVNVKAALKAQEVQFTPQDLADWLQDADDISDWVKHVRSLALSEALEGREVAGMELDQSIGNASWSEDDKTVERRLGSYGLNVHERCDVKTISPTVARKLLKDKGVDKNIKLVEKMIHRPLGGKKLVPAGTAKNPITAVSEKIASLGEKLKGKTAGGSEENESSAKI